MSAQPYMQLWIADFIGDTLHLSDAEIGQYMLLLMAMWRNGGYLPDDPKKLARIARNEVSESVMQMFSKSEANACICQKRLLVELQKAKAKSEARSEAGKWGAQVKALKNNKPAKAKAIAKAKAKVQHSPEPEPVSTNVETNIGETPLSILKTILDDEHSEAVVAYRKRQKQPLNLIAARRLANQLGRWPKPNEAAAEMMVRTWRGFQPEWMENRGSTGPPAKRSASLDYCDELLVKNGKSDEAPANTTIEGDYRRIGPG